MTYAFKVGDRVKCIREPADTYEEAPLLGKVGIVTEIADEHGGPAVSWFEWNDGWGDEEDELYVDNEDIALIGD